MAHLEAELARFEAELAGTNGLQVDDMILSSFLNQLAANR